MSPEEIKYAWEILLNGDAKDKKLAIAILKTSPPYHLPGNYRIYLQGIKQKWTLADGAVYLQIGSNTIWWYFPIPNKIQGFITNSEATKWENCGSIDSAEDYVSSLTE